MMVNPYFPPPNPFETHLFERLRTYAQGYLPLPGIHGLRAMDEAVLAEWNRRQEERMAELDAEIEAKEKVRAAERERKRKSSLLYGMKSWVTTASTPLLQRIKRFFIGK